ncbi:hypothetical protein J2848_005385, partial [Azospirillum lipoferum]|nr:hypothetical protein [Azospirillum lipoferum]
CKSRSLIVIQPIASLPAVENLAED